MTIKRQLTVFYSTLYFVIVGLFVLSVSILNFGTLENQATESMETVVNNTKSMIEMNFDNVIKNYLRGVAEKDRDTVAWFYGEYQAGRMTEDQAKKMASSALLSQKIGETGYVYCIDSGGIVKVHPRKELLGTDHSSDDFIKVQKRDKRGYLEYEWAAPGETVKRSKALYMEYFAPWDWIISASSYRTEFQSLIGVDDFEKGILDIKLGQTGYVYVMDTQGNLLVHPTLKGKNIAESKDDNGFFYIKEILKRKDGSLSYAWRNPDERYAREKVVYFRTNEELGLVIAGGTYKDELLAASFGMVGLSVTLFILGFLVIFLLSTWVAGYFARPLKDSMDLMRGISQGDLTVTLDPKIARRKDEIGEMARAAADMQLKLGTLTASVRSNAAAVQEGAVVIGGAIDEQAATVTEMSASVAEITSTMEELSASSTQIADHAKSVVDIANQTWENSKKGSQSMTILQDKIEGIRTDNKASLDEIVELGSKSKEISKVMAIINTIADQTKLIAFNAALEASSAGDAGKRFGVVAAEIRHLADSVTSSTGEIETKISEIQDSISRLVITSEKRAMGIADGMQAAVQTSQMLAELVGAASQTTSAAQQISLSTQQQRTASTQAVIALREIDSASQHTNESITRIAEISHGMTATSTRLNDLVGQFKVAREG